MPDEAIPALNTVQPVTTHESVRMPALAKLHLLTGAATLLAFLVSGVYMRLHPPRELSAAAHVMFTSRHIYILAAALIHLLLGSYAEPAGIRATAITQWVGSTFLLLASVLLILAFLHEPMAGRGRTEVSRFGLYTLFAGSVLHVGAGLRVTRRMS
jgi:drug/metabolite transporter superfamily protein YnfA